MNDWRRFSIGGDALLYGGGDYQVRRVRELRKEVGGKVVKMRYMSLNVAPSRLTYLGTVVTNPVKLSVRCAVVQ